MAKFAIVTLLKSLLGGSLIDLEKKKAKLVIPGIVTIGGIPLSRAVRLSRDPSAIEEVLSTCFLQRRTQWAFISEFGFHHAAESLGACIESLTVVLNKLELSRDEGERFLGELVRVWQNEMVLALKALRYAAKKAANKKAMDFPADADPRAIDRLNSAKQSELAILQMRRKVFPVVCAIAEFLPPNNLVRHSVWAQISRGLAVFKSPAMDEAYFETEAVKANTAEKKLKPTKPVA